MKHLFILLLAGILAVTTACRKGSETPGFDYQKAAGIWVPFEYTDPNGVTQITPLSASNIFGVYAESVKLNPDRSFVPVSWIDSANYLLRQDQQGTYEYLHNRNVLVFNGVWRLDLIVTRFRDPELWLMDGSGLYKFKRKF